MLLKGSASTKSSQQPIFKFISVLSFFYGLAEAFAWDFFSLEIEISTNTTLHFSLEVLIAPTVPSACHKEEWKLEMRNQDNKKKKPSRQSPVVNTVKISKILKDKVEKSVKLDLETRNGIQEEPASRARVWRCHWDKFQNIRAKI